MPVARRGRRLARNAVAATVEARGVELIATKEYSRPCLLNGPGSTARAASLNPEVTALRSGRRSRPGPRS
jgi:hypothetical protein